MEKNISLTVPAEPGALNLASKFLSDMAALYGGTGLQHTVDTSGGPGGPGDADDAGDAGDVTVLELGEATKTDPTLVPWDKRIHQEAKVKKYANTNVWKAKKSLDPAVLATVLAELKAAGADTTVDTSGGPGGPDTTVDTSGGPGGPADDATVEITFAKIMQDLTPQLKASKITDAQVGEVLAQTGLKSIPELIKPENEPLRAPVYEALAAIWNNTP